MTTSSRYGQAQPNEPVDELVSAAGTAWVNPRRVQVVSTAARHAAYMGHNYLSGLNAPKRTDGSD